MGISAFVMVVARAKGSPMGSPSLASHKVELTVPVARLSTLMLELLSSSYTATYALEDPTTGREMLVLELDQLQTVPPSGAIAVKAIMLADWELTRSSPDSESANFGEFRGALRVQRNRVDGISLDVRRLTFPARSLMGPTTP